MFLSRKIVIQFGISVFMIKHTNAASGDVWPADDAFEDAVVGKFDLTDPDHFGRYKECVRKYFESAMTAIGVTTPLTRTDVPGYPGAGESYLLEGEGFGPDKIAVRVARCKFLCTREGLDHDKKREIAEIYKNAANARHALTHTGASDYDHDDPRRQGAEQRSASSLVSTILRENASDQAPEEQKTAYNNKLLFKQKLADKIEKTWLDALNQCGKLLDDQGKACKVRPEHNPRRPLKAAVRKFFRSDEKLNDRATRRKVVQKAIERYLYKTYHHPDHKHDTWIKGWTGHLNVATVADYERWDKERAASPGVVTYD